MTLTQEMEQKLEGLLRSDQQRMAILQAVFSMDLPDCWVGAGFLRNLVWDFIHGFSSSPLNDVDVVYFDSGDTIDNQTVESRLTNIIPAVLWQVRNQAAMHSRNHDSPYLDVKDAISFWPEKETAVAARLTSNHSIEIIAPFGTSSLFSGEINRNPKRSRELFENRIRDKQWLKFWPKLIAKPG